MFENLNEEFIYKKDGVIKLKNVFSESARINDEIRYVVKIRNGKCINRTRVCKSIDEIDDEQENNLKTVVLLLESPHRSEYRVSKNRMIPIGPAQGEKPADAGGGIDKYLDKVIDKMGIIDGSYYILISNPIQFQTSLGSLYKRGLNTTLRNLIWSNLWDNKEVKQDFIERLNKYRPMYILNACTLQLRDKVNMVLIQNGYKEITFIAYHPAVNWNCGRLNVTKLE